MIEKKTFLVLALLLHFSTNARSQSFLGEWYLINEEHVSEMVVYTDSLVIKLYQPDLNSTPYREEKIFIEEIIETQNSSLLIIQSEKDTSKFAALTFFNIVENVSMDYVMIEDSLTNKLDSFLRNYQKNEKSLIGFTFYNKDLLPEIRGLKKVKDITFEDFNDLLMCYIKYGDNYQYIPGKPEWPYKDQLITNCLIKLGYNPINRGRVIDENFEKFFGNEETQKLFEKLNER